MAAHTFTADGMQGFQRSGISQFCGLYLKREARRDLSRL